jgi:hypothetical protein
MDQKSIKELKMDLYRALLLKEPAGLTDNEIDISYYLAQDEEIQEILREAMKKEKEEEGDATTH